jgi:hypothetical protein
MKKIFIPAAALILFVLTLPLTGGVVITETTTDVIEDFTETNKIYMAENWMRSGTGEEYMIFRKDLQVLWVVNAVNETYREFTQQQAAQMLGGMEDFEEEVEPTYEKMASNVEAGRWTADQYAEFEYGEKTAELWFVPFDRLGIKKTDFTIAAAFESFLDPENPARELGDLTEWKDIAGEYVYPVREESYFDGELETVTEIVSIERESIPAEVFEVPAGFKKL